jgi:hypothetical protein
LDILVQEKPKSIKLADGKEYTLPVIDLTTLANLEKALGWSLSRIGVKMETETMQTLQSLIFALLKENYSDITREAAGHLVTINEFKLFGETISSIMAISG